MAITFDNTIGMSYMLFYNSANATYTSRNTTSGDYFNNNSIIGDCLYFTTYFGAWHNLTLTVGTPLAATSITLIWEFSYGATPSSTPTWSELSVTDGTNNFTQTGIVNFDVPDNWIVCNKLDGVTANYSGLFIRARITAVDTLTEGGANSGTAVYGKDYAIKVTGTGNRLSAIKTANDSGGWGVVSQLGNTYQILSNLKIGDGTTTDFKITDYETLELGSPTKRRHFFNGYDQNTFTMGDLTSGNYSLGSCFKYYNSYFNAGIGSNWQGVVNIYNSTLYRQYGSFYDAVFYRVTVSIYNSVLESESTFYFRDSCIGNIQNTTFVTGSTSTYLYVYSGSLTVNNISFGKSLGILAGSANAIVQNVDFGTNKQFGVTNYTTCYARNCKFQNSYTAQVVASGISALQVPNIAIIQYTLTLKVYNEKGVLINNPTIKLTNSSGTVIHQGIYTTGIICNVWQESNVIETSYNPFTLLVYVPGRETYRQTFVLDYTSKDVTIRLRNCPSSGRDQMGDRIN